MEDLHQEKNQLIEKIKKFNQKKSLFTALRFFFSISAFITIFLFAYILLEVFFYFQPSVKSLLLFITALTASIAFIYFLWNPIKNYIESSKIENLYKASKEIGENEDGVSDSLLNVIQLIKKSDNSSSESLINSAFKSVYNRVKGINFQKIITPSKTIRSGIIFISVFLLSVILIDFSNPLKAAFSRIINYDKVYTKPIAFSLKILNEAHTIIEGNDYTIKILGTGKIPDNIFIAAKTNSEVDYNNYRVKPDSNSLFKTTLRNVKNSFSFYAYIDDIQTETLEVELISPPLINNLELDIIPPQYSSLPKVHQENNGNIIALPGSRINFQFEATKDIETVSILFSDSIPYKIEIENNFVFGSFKIYNNLNYAFEITDNDNIKNENPITYNINTLTDHYPDIEIVIPENISLIPNNDIVSINYNIRDDYGFSRVNLIYQVHKNGSMLSENISQNINLPISRKELEQNLFFNWDVSQIGLRENEVINYYLAVADNDNISGPKLSRTPDFKLRVPSLEEMFQEADNIQNAAIDDLTQTLKEAEELKRELTELENDLKQDQKEIEWEEKEEIENSMKKFEELAEKMENVQEKLNSMQKQMAEQDLLSEETMQKYNELQELIDEINSEELQKALSEMQNSLENLMREDIQKALENFSMNEEVFQKSIERTLNLLKKIQIEQKVDEIIKRTEKITEEVNQLKEKSEQKLNNSSDTENNESVENQKKVSDEIESLEREMQELQQKMSEFNEMPSDKMEKMNNEMTEQDNKKLSEDALSDLQKNDFSKALKNQQMLSENMNSMMQQMQQMQQQMQQQSQQMVMQDMLKAIENIIGLSKEQEIQKTSTDLNRSNPGSLPNLTQPQMDLKQNLDRILNDLSELSQNTFAITPEMGDVLGQARNDMNSAINGMQERNGMKASLSQNDAMKNLNMAATFLQNSLQAMMQGGGQGSGGMMSLMQQLQQMAQQQMGINKMTQMMQTGQLSMEQRAQLQRLAQQQAAIQKSLNELNREARESGESKKITTDLQNVIDEMNEVISGFNTKKVDDDLIKTQEKILSKLLDAQRSINERDFEKNRESLTGKSFNVDSPSQLNLQNLNETDLLREELLKSMKDGYSKDYQELIRRYFKKLNENLNN